VREAGVARAGASCAAVALARARAAFVTRRRRIARLLMRVEACLESFVRTGRSFRPAGKRFDAPTGAPRRSGRGRPPGRRAPSRAHQVKRWRYHLEAMTGVAGGRKRARKPTECAADASAVPRRHPRRRGAARLHRSPRVARPRGRGATRATPRGLAFASSRAGTMASAGASALRRDERRRRPARLERQSGTQRDLHRTAQQSLERHRYGVRAAHSLELAISVGRSPGARRSPHAVPHRPP
jgi:hypothetical protein